MMKRIRIILLLLLMITQSGVMSLVFALDAAHTPYDTITCQQEIGTCSAEPPPVEEDARETEVPEPWEEDTFNEYASYCLHGVSRGSERIPHPASGALEGAPGCLLKPPTAIVSLT